MVDNPVDADTDRLGDADAKRFGSAGMDRKLIRSGCSIGMSAALVPRMIFATISARRMQGSNGVSASGWLNIRNLYPVNDR